MVFASQGPRAIGRSVECPWYQIQKTKPHLYFRPVCKRLRSCGSFQQDTPSARKISYLAAMSTRVVETWQPTCKNKQEKHRKQKCCGKISPMPISWAAKRRRSWAPLALPLPLRRPVREVSECPLPRSEFWAKRSASFFEWRSVGTETVDQMKVDRVPLGMNVPSKIRSKTQCLKI